MTACPHPLSERNVVGNPDPFDRRPDGLFQHLGIDAECNLCGANVKVFYTLWEEKSA